MEYKRARDFAAVIDAVFPEGQNTLTAKNSRHALLLCLMNKPKSLTKIIGKGLPLPLKTTVDALVEAQQKIDTLLLSPVPSALYFVKRPTFQ
jgi:hypothetical protein